MYRVPRNIRLVLAELRKSVGSPLVKKDAVRDILQQCRNHQLTQQVLCKEPHEMTHMLNTFSTYLHSRRMYWEILTKFKGKGERSPEEMCDLLGFSTPKAKKT